MADVQVTCINLANGGSGYYGISHLGGFAWRWTRQQVIDSIIAGTNTFYTSVNGRRANIHVVNGTYGQYVQTYADGQWTDNLLALTTCPVR